MLFRQDNLQAITEGPREAETYALVDEHSHQDRAVRTCFGIGRIFR